MDAGERTTLPTDGGPVDVGGTLAAYRHGHRDPTTTLRVDGAAGVFLHATLTPDGPASIRIGWSTGPVSVDQYGPGGAWLAAQVPRMLGEFDRGLGHVDTSTWDPLVVSALRRHRGVRIGSSGNLYHGLLPTVLEQRITAGEALTQWRALCLELGDAAPGPFPGLRLPPSPETIRARPTWWFHRLGIERKRAAALVEVARHAAKYWDWAASGIAHCAGRLRLVPGVGVWTVGKVSGPALGDADAVAVGDFHLKNVVGFALAREPRATDERMLELLEPYAGQRGRVVNALLLDGHAAPRYGPGKRILAIRTL